MLALRALRGNKLCSLSYSAFHKATIYTGRATPEGTSAFCSTTAKLSAGLDHAVLPTSKWAVNRIGFSGCKLTSNSNDHKASLDAALASFTNYVSIPASAESLLAQVLSPLIDLKDISREQIVVAVKMGILREAQLKDLNTTFEQAVIYNKNSELHKYMYSISPDFLKFKIEDSLKTLDLDCLDLVMLEDPVFNFLQENEGSSEEMYNRIEKAFVYLESEVAAGRIQYYGISSEAFLLPSDSPNHLSLSRLIQIAKTNNLKHFAAIEYPHNLLENGAYTLCNNENNTKTVSELAKEQNIMQIGHRPLTVSKLGRQFRLKTLSKHEDRDIDGLMNESFKFCTHLEKASPVVLQEELDINFDFPHVNDVIWTQYLGANLVDGAHYLYKYLNWVELDAKPRLERACNQLSKNSKFIIWSARYKAAVDALFTRCQWALERSSYITATRLQESLARKSHQLLDLDLAHQALRIALSGGPDVVLSGMRGRNNLIHTTRLDQHPHLTPTELQTLFKQMRFFTSLFLTDDAIGWYEPGSAENKKEDLMLELVSFGSGSSLEEGSISDRLKKEQMANPLKLESPIY